LKSHVQASAREPIALSQHMEVLAYCVVPDNASRDEGLQTFRAPPVVLSTC
jgi:hypothetical protein